jgi:hypothetical protein
MRFTLTLIAGIVVGYAMAGNKDLRINDVERGVMAAASKAASFVRKNY